jgi:RNA polymerase sigma factor (sigma-70 family)
MKRIKYRLRLNPYDVMEFDEEVSPEQAALTRMQYEAMPDLPVPAPILARATAQREAERQRQAALAEAHARPLPTLTRLQSAAGLLGDLSPEDLSVAVALRAAQRDVEHAMVARDTGATADDSEIEEAQEWLEATRDALKRQGHTNLTIQRAQERVYKNLLSSAYRAARKRIGAGSSLDRNEIAAEAAVKAYMNIDKYEGESRLSTWVFPFVRNLVIDAATRVTAGGFGKEGTRAHVPGGLTGRGTTVGESVEFEEDIYADAPTVFQRHTLTPAEIREQEGEIIEEFNLGEQRRRRSRARADQQDAIVSEALSKLSPEHQMILRLRVAQGQYQMPDGSVLETGGGLSHVEMAQILGVPKGTAQSRLGRARAKMLKLVGDRVKPPYVGRLAAAWLGEGRVATVSPEGQVVDVRPEIYKVEGRVGVVRRERRTNPFVEGTEFYYETPRDLLDLWLDGQITQEQFDVCMSVFEAEIQGVLP